MDKRSLMIRYAWSFVGQPYLWGGDDPVGGFDCSGFTSELNRALGIFGVRDRMSAQDTHNWLLSTGKGRLIEKQRAGCFVFW